VCGLKVHRTESISTRNRLERFEAPLDVAHPVLLHLAQAPLGQVLFRFLRVVVETLLGCIYLQGVLLALLKVVFEAKLEVLLAQSHAFFVRMGMRRL